MIKILILLTLILSNLGLNLLTSNIHSTSFNVPDNLTVNVAIVFPPKNIELLQYYVQTHKILTINEIKKLFIPQDSIDKTKKLLESYGLQVKQYLNVVVVTGEIKILEKLLNGKFYIYNWNSTKFYIFLGSPKFNAIVFSTNLTTALIKPLYIKLTQALAYSEIEPKDLWKAYNTSTLYNRGINGSGVNIGILAFDGNPYIDLQLKQFDKIYDLPDPPIFKTVPIGPYNPNDGLLSGWALEISLDVEYVHVMAPSAGIILYVANIDFPLPAAIAKIVEDGEVSVVSQSFGIPEIYVLLGLIPLSYVQALLYEYWLGSVSGITFIAASGDAGGNGYNFFLSTVGSQLLPASIPYVLSVGGTSLYVAGDSTLQTAWSGQGIFGSSTGGFSSIFPAPPYQGASGFRMIPDVSALANPYTGVPVLYYDNKTYLVGGTSLAAPIVAGIIALAIQHNGKLGFINPLLYNLINTSSIVPIRFGYNVPYVSYNYPNPVTGLGYLNAGIFVYSIKKPEYYVVVSTYNSTFTLNSNIRIVADIVPRPSTPPTNLKGYIYDGKSIIQIFDLKYNGTKWIGNVSINKSGVFEIIVKYNNYFGFNYITVGYQAVFLLPYVAVYPERTLIPVLAIITFVNGSLAINANISPYLDVFKYNIINDSLVFTKRYILETGLAINITQYGIKINRTSSILSGYLNFENESKLGGIYMLKIPNVFGLTEFVLGIYVVPIIIPSIITSPNVISTFSNFTIYVYTLTLGNPNVTVNVIKNGKIVYKTNLYGIIYNNNLYYLSNIRLNNLSSGVYTMFVNASYSRSNYTIYGYGVTQIFISNQTLNVKINVKSIAYQGENLKVYANITYQNGTQVKYGSFVITLIPIFMIKNFDSLSLQYSTDLRYQDGEWFGVIKIPSGNEANNLESSTYGISGIYNLYINGISYNLIPINFSTYLDIDTLSIIPTVPISQIVVLPKVYTSYFNGSIAYNQYIVNADIINHNATFVNSFIENLTIKNGTVILINSYVNNLINLGNGRIITYGNSSVITTSISNKDYIDNELNQILIYIILLIILIIPLIILLRKK
jgi:subtilase family serine protease